MVDSFPDIRKVPDGLRVVADLSTIHLHRSDAQILERSNRSDFSHIIGQNDYGYWVETFRPDDNPALLEAGFTQDYCKLMNDLNAHSIYYANFDCDAEPWACLPQYEKEWSLSAEPRQAP